MEEPMDSDEARDDWQNADQIRASTVREIARAIVDPNRFPLLASINPARVRRCRRQLNLCAAFGTPLMIQATKNELTVEAATVGQKAGGRVALLMRTLSLANPPQRLTQKKTSYLKRFRGEE